MPSKQKPVGSPSQSAESVEADPFTLYSRSLQNYTLGLWTESRRVAEERASAIAKQEEAERERPSIKSSESLSS